MKRSSMLQCFFQLDCHLSKWCFWREGSQWRFLRKWEKRQKVWFWEVVRQKIVFITKYTLFGSESSFLEFACYSIKELFQFLPAASYIQEIVITASFQSDETPPGVNRSEGWTLVFDVYHHLTSFPAIPRPNLSLLCGALSSTANSKMKSYRLRCVTTGSIWKQDIHKTHQIQISLELIQKLPIMIKNSFLEFHVFKVAECVICQEF